MNTLRILLNNFRGFSCIVFQDENDWVGLMKSEEDSAFDAYDF